MCIDRRDGEADGPDDRALVLAAQHGDKHALAALLVRHRPLLLGLCRRMLADEHLLQDAEQEASLRALLCVGELRAPDRFGAWLGGIGLNVCRQLLRERARLLPLSRTSSEHALPREPVAKEPGPAELAEAADTARRVRRAVAELPAGQRDAATRFYLAGRSQLEVAVDLGIGVGAVKTRLHKARANLRTRLREEIEMAMPKDDALVPMRVAEVRCETASHDDAQALRPGPPGGRRYPRARHLGRQDRGSSDGLLDGRRLGLTAAESSVHRRAAVGRCASPCARCAGPGWTVKNRASRHECGSI